jgi:hypothetical protein
LAAPVQQCYFSTISSCHACSINRGIAAAYDSYAFSALRLSPLLALPQVFYPGRHTNTDLTRNPELPSRLSSKPQKYQRMSLTQVIQTNVAANFNLIN